MIYQGLCGGLRQQTDHSFVIVLYGLGKKQERETDYLNLFIFRVSLRIVRIQTALKRMQQLFSVSRDTTTLYHIHQ